MEDKKMNYSYDQVKPILDRILSQLDSLSPADILAFSTKAESERAFVISEKGEKFNYDLVIFGYGIRLKRDGKIIHESRTTITHLSRLLRSSASYANPSSFR